jgi:sigma-B regulation protein RsbU (phosphoserine phosphatase)
VSRPVGNALATDGDIKLPVEKGIWDSKILIADDEPLCCRLLAGILRRAQFNNVQFAHGGHSTLKQIQSFRPDLVLLDMQMPELSGQEVCRQIRTDPELVDLPILMQTATVDRKEMGILFEAGASDFLSKPINPAELVSRVTLHLERWNLLRKLRDYRQRTSMELEAARRMQFDLLPAQATLQALGESAGLRIGSYSRSSSEIGGDLWGILPINDVSFGLFLADFAGHGVTAALNTFRLHALIHEHTALHHDPAGLLAILNDRLKEVLSPGQFATFLYVVIDSSFDRIRFASAGAPPPIVTLGLHGPAVLAEVSGLPLGVARGAKYELHERPFSAGSMLVLFSDGLSEFPDPRGRRIGDEGLRSTLGACDPGLTPDQVIEQLCEATGIGTNSALPDDTTIVCLDRRIGSASPASPDCLNGQAIIEVRDPRGLLEVCGAAQEHSQCQEL